MSSISAAEWTLFQPSVNPVGDATISAELHIISVGHSGRGQPNGKQAVARRRDVHSVPARRHFTRGFPTRKWLERDGYARSDRTDRPSSQEPVLNTPNTRKTCVRHAECVLVNHASAGIAKHESFKGHASVTAPSQGANSRPGGNRGVRDGMQPRWVQTPMHWHARGGGPGRPGSMPAGQEGGPHTGEPTESEVPLAGFRESQPAILASRRDSQPTRQATSQLCSCSIQHVGRPESQCAEPNQHSRVWLGMRHR